MLVDLRLSEMDLHILKMFYSLDDENFDVLYFLSLTYFDCKMEAHSRRFAWNGYETLEKENEGRKKKIEKEMKLLNIQLERFETFKVIFNKGNAKEEELEKEMEIMESENIPIISTDVMEKERENDDEDGEDDSNSSTYEGGNLTSKEYQKNGI